MDVVPGDAKSPVAPSAKPTELLATFDAQLRGVVPDSLPEGVTLERDGPLLRYTDRRGGGWLDYHDLGGLEEAELDELIARQTRVFAERGMRFEWKYFAHDLPPDLPERLVAAGLEPEEVEAMMVAEVAAIAAAPRVPEGVTLAEVTAREDFDRIAAMEETIWRDQRGWLADMLESERAVDPDALTVVVAEAAGAIVCAGWIRFRHGTEFASLWGGGTLPEWRSRGIYRALVAYRARLAASRGVRYLYVDASTDSQPILQRLGFVVVTMTTPYIWSPPSG
jgi:GNAT superfamily N-acetyltransferase